MLSVVASPCGCSRLLQAGKVATTLGIQTSALQVPIVHHNQVRYAKKTFRFKYAYGEVPLHLEEQYAVAKDNGELDELKVKRIRQAKIQETSSPLWDKDFEKFTRYVMKGGRYGLASRLMRETFYEIKCIQRARLRKLKQGQAASVQASPSNIDVASQNEDRTSAINKEAQVVADSSKAPEKDENENDEEEDSIELNPLIIFKEALDNAKPMVIVRKIKRGGATYDVPFPIDSKMAEYYATKWLIKAILDRPKPREKNFPECMAKELVDCHQKRGQVIRQRDEMHRIANENKAFAHYRFA